MTVPLSGVRALELAEIWAGPYCGSLLGDLGAEVIKVESIQRIARGSLQPGPNAPGYPDREPGEHPWNRVGNFNALNRNKLSITLDLTSRRGVELFRELAKVSDVVFTNYSYGVMDSFGLDYQALRSVRPDIIVVAMPGFGNSGPYRRYRSMGMTIDAITGHSALRGYPDMDLSAISPVHHADAVGGVTAVFALAAALHHRARTGKGQYLDMSQAEAFIPHLGEVFMEYIMNGRVRQRLGNHHPSMAPHGCYPCQGEDRWVTIAVRNDPEWRALCQAIGSPELVYDERFATVLSRVRHQEELDSLIGQWTRTRDQYQVMHTLQAVGVPSGPVLDCCGDTYDNPHLQARGYFLEVTHPEAGTYLNSGPLWRLSSDPEPTQAPTPCLGEHNQYILGEVLGLSPERMADLEAQQVIGTIPLEGSDLGGVRRVRSGA